jgi:hypothetical protein
MRILRSIVGTQSLLVPSREANFAKRRSVGSEFVGDDNRRNEALTPKQFPQQLQRRGLVALGLDPDFENLAFAVDRAICTFAVQRLTPSFHRDAIGSSLHQYPFARRCTPIVNPRYWNAFSIPLSVDAGKVVLQLLLLNMQHPGRGDAKTS